VIEVELSEGGPPQVVPLADDVGDALAASEVVSAFRVGGGQWEVTANTKVGVAAVSGVTLWIKPKVDIRRILFLLGYAKSAGWRDDTVALAQVTDLVPALAHAFADQSERALNRGLVQGYVEVDDSLTVLRGRLRDEEQLRRRFGIAVPLLVRFDDYTADIAENQLLRAAAELLLRLPGVTPRTRARLRRIRQDLADVTPHVRGTPLPTWTPTRLNARYHVALWLAELILRGNAVDQAPGDVRLGGFLVDMAKVFEDFLTAALTEAFRPHGGWARPQDRHHLDADDLVAIRPDLVWYQHGEPAAVIDAKYKAEKPAGFPDADLYQMLAYCTALGLPDGHLVYAKGNALEVTHKVRRVSVLIHAHTVDLDALPTQLLGQVQDLAARIAATTSARTFMTGTQRTLAPQ
jgi:5-methylcytosine-specific restriction enzyme subunit McrC